MCLILAGSSSLTSLVREAATKRALQPRQPIRAAEDRPERARVMPGRPTRRTGWGEQDLVSGRFSKREQRKGINWWGVGGYF